MTRLEPRGTNGVAAAVLLLATALAGLVACGGSQPVATRAAARPPASAPAQSPPSGSPGASPAPTASHTPVPATTGPVPAAAGPVVAAGWVGPIYAPGGHGYDVSYPQCSGGRLPVAAPFSIVGVTGGRGFSLNPCLRTQWQAAKGRRAVYFNSGYDPANAGRATPDCLSRSRYQDGGAPRQTAYAIGCSEAVYAVNAMNAAGVSRAAMIWLDVESSNRWDGSDLDMNRTALQAEIDQLAAFGRLVGLYATFAEWRGIVGDWSPAGVVADWVAGRQRQTACAAQGFSGHPVWLVQELATWPLYGIDSDWSC